MNARIKQLAEHAKEYVDDKWAKEGSPKYPEAHYLFLQQRDEKFAELIVKECIFVMKSTVDESIDLDRKLDETSAWIESDIKQHFGVEE